MRYIVVVNTYLESIGDAIRQLRVQPAYADLGILLLTTKPEKYEHLTDASFPTRIIECSFKSKQEILTALEPFRQDIFSVVCRGDRNVQYLRKLVPCLPKGVHVASPQALKAATNKSTMRAAFKQHAPEITPDFVEVTDGSAASIAEVEGILTYPVFVKPADLASSLLTGVCNSRAELEHALRTMFVQIKKVYKHEERHKRPQVLVEDYLEGEFYSIDAYVLDKGEVYYCPPVRYIPAKQLGIDDFFIYKRYTPTDLPGAEVHLANETAGKAIAATGLTYSAAHVELVRTKQGWKIIELGPRLGRFRHAMYLQGYGIDHALNDVKIHMGLKPYIPTKQIGYAVGYCIYPTQEGTLRAVRGLSRLRDDPHVLYLRDLAEPGTFVTFARNGGHSLADILVATTDKPTMQKLVEYIEKQVRVSIE